MDREGSVHHAREDTEAETALTAAEAIQGD